MLEPDSFLNLKDVLEQIPPALILLDSAGVIRYFNASARKLIRKAFGSEAQIGQKARDLNLDAALQEFFDQAVEFKKLRLEHRLNLPGGGSEQLLLESNPIFDRADTDFKVTCISITTASPFRLDSLQEAAHLAKFETLIQNSRELIVILGVDGVIKFVSPSSENILGYKPEEMLGRNSFYFLHPDDVQIARETFAKSLRGPGSHRLAEVRYRRADGSWIYLDNVANNRLDDPGIEGVVITAHDVSERQKSAATSYQLAAIVESSNDAIFATDLNGVVINWNPAAKTIYGYSAQEIVGQPIAILIPPERLWELNTILERSRQGETITQYETVRRHKDGSLIDIALSVAPLKDGYGRIIGTASIARDITIRKRAERRLTAQYEIARLLAGSGGTEETIWVEVLQILCKHLEWDVGTLWIADNKRGDSLNFKALWHNPVTPLDDFIQATHAYRFGATEGIPELAVNTRKQVWIPDITTRLDCRRTEVASKTGLKSALAYPILVNKVVVGVLDFFSRQGHQPAYDSFPMLDTISSQIGQYIERRRAERELEQEHTFATLIMQAMGQGLTVTNEQKQITFVNEAYAALLGYTPEELIGKSPFDFTHPDDRAILENARLERLEGKGSTYENRLIKKNGELVYAIITGVPYRRDGKIVGSIAVITDLTERNKTEEALRRSQEHFAKIFRASPVSSVISTLEEGRYLDVNETFLKLMGYSREEMIGHTSSELQIWVNLDDRRTLVEQLRQRHSIHNQEFRLRAKNGKILDCLSSVEVINLDDQECVLYLFQDITELKQAEQRRIALERNLLETQKLESLGVMAGGIAHDFNNLLVGMLGNAELARSKLSPGSPAYQDVRQIEVAATRASELVLQLLAYVGKGRFEVHRLDLNKLLQETGELLKVSVGKKTSLQYRLAPELPPVEVDATQLRQVVMNLVVNASEAIGSNEGVITLSTGQVFAGKEYLAGTYLGADRPEGNYVYLEIADNGAGMQEEVQAKIFEPFFTTKFTGRGLGLAAVLGIVRSHHGALTVNSQPGQGTTFRILLPLAAGPLPVTIPATPQTNSRPNQGRGQKKVLIIDDEETVLYVAGRILETNGYRVLTASDGSKGLEIFKANAADLDCVLLDLTMPGLGGEVVLERIKALQPDSRVILMSGYSEHELVTLFSGKGLAGFVQKPFTTRDLLQAVQNAQSRLTPSQS